MLSASRLMFRVGKLYQHTYLSTKLDLDKNTSKTLHSVHVMSCLTKSQAELCSERIKDCIYYTTLQS